MQIITQLLADALFLAAVLLFVSADRRISKLETLFRRDADAALARVAEAERSLSELNAELSRVNAPNGLPQSFGAGLADILGYAPGESGSAKVFAREADGNE
ncbi:MAG: hypothetical protein LBS90_00685 [Oscillospiraceae bacterium]|jgi:hypothetical protein|nr:hypothetical protein [Oscillospiraceae bacterium]